ncbi:MAG TPA: vitamin B12 dependent-methionine synthase activation domain-containing protein, partial [Ignavibacteria bacterium]|nr:vitamin B12 dependent-methionine synthase activation domain-containing protein [Ignavibacteria bacterium]
QKPYLTYEEAKKNKLKIEFKEEDISKPEFTGIKVFDDYPLEEIAEYIDWAPFFRTWELAGKYPEILEDKIVGEQARELLKDAKALLDKIIKEKWLQAKGVIGIWNVNSVGDDIEVYTDESRKEVKKVFHTLRQQGQKSSNVPNIALSDFIAPKETGLNDYFGGFAVTAGIGIEKWIKKFADDHDDYNKIMLQALGDRLAEAFAELMHKKVRTEYWGYSKDEKLGNDDLIKEKYVGIRPAPGYPACPDHTEKWLLFEMLDAEKNAGIKLTESLAMYPASSVSGMYYAHPQSRYFGLGKIGKDQVEDYAERKGMKIGEIERWLSSNLNYE